MDIVEWTEPEVGIGALAEIPVEGATAEIITAWLPSQADYGKDIVVWLDFRNTSSETISVRPHLYYIGWADHGFSAKELEPGQSFSEKYGKKELGYLWFGATRVAPWDVERVEAGIDVFTPEGWVEVDRVTAPPLEWPSTPPEFTITSAPEYALPGTEVTINFEVFNPGFTNYPAGYVVVNGKYIEENGETFLWFPPDQSTPFTYSFIMGDQDKTITLTPSGGGLTGEPVSVTIKSGAAPAGCLPIVAAGILLVAGIIAGIIIAFV